MMPRRWFRPLLVVGCLAAAAALLAGRSLAEDWPAWRGPQGTGSLPKADKTPPVKFGPETNVRWKVALPEPGNSTPVVWGDRIFLTQPLANAGKRTLMCLDRGTGELLWQQAVEYSEPEQSHRTNPYCSASPVTDGERVVVWYGSAGLFCYDMQGKLQWKRDLGEQTHEWGYGSSPVLYNDLCFLNFGPGEEEFVIAVNKKTGATLWKQPVPKFDPNAPVADEDKRGNGAVGQGLLRGSWATPVVMSTGDRDELIVPLPERVMAFEPISGEKLWTCEGLGGLVYCSPVVGKDAEGKDIVICFGGYKSASLAVRPGGSGDVTEDRRLWHEQVSRLRLGTGVLRDGYLYVNDMQGIVECQEAATGKTLWRERLAGKGSDTWASLTMVGDVIYMPNQAGDLFAFRANPEKFEPLGEASFEEQSNSSVVLADGSLLFRTHKHLWCFGK